MSSRIFYQSNQKLHFQKGLNFRNENFQSVAILHKKLKIFNFVFFNFNFFFFQNVFYYNIPLDRNFLAIPNSLSFF